MSLAFLIMAHKNVGQFARLFRVIHRPGDIVLLHVDRRADRSLHDTARRFARHHRNVQVVPPRRIVWGGFVAAQVQLDAMAIALRSHPHWTHFINLSGQDFPVKRLDQLDAHLAADPDANYISWFDPAAKPLWGNALERIERYHLASASLDRLLQIPGLGRRLRLLLNCQNQPPHLPFLRRRPPPFHYYGGSNYVVLSRAASEYVVSDPYARRIARWLRHTLHPDEILMQSVVLNSRFAPTVVNTSLHAIDFTEGSPHPKTYRREDLSRLIESPKFFARKFDPATDPTVIDRLAEALQLSAP